MEDFEKQVRKYREEIKELESDNTSLKKKRLRLKSRLKRGRKPVFQSS